MNTNKKYLFNYMTFLFGIVILTYSHTLFFSFTYFDDDAILIRNLDWLSNEASFSDAFITDAEFQSQKIELYRPLQNLSFIVDAKLLKTVPFQLHLTNLLLHLLSVFALFIFLLEFEKERFKSFLISVLFALHPVLAYTISWLPARGDLFLALFVILSFYFYIKFLKNRQIYWLFFHFISFSLALFSKESALMLLPIIFIYHFLFKISFKDVKFYLLLILGYLALFALYFYFRNISITSNSLSQFNFEHVFVNILTIPETIFYLILPFSIPVLPFYTKVISIFGFVIILLFFYLLYRFRSFSPKVIFGIIWFILFLLPGMLYIPSWSEFIYEYLLHRTYLPFIGLLIVISSFSFPSSILHFSMRNKLVAGGLLILLIILNFSFSIHFRSPISFWSYATKTNSSSAFSHAYLGNAYMLEKKYSKAILSYNEALKLKPDFYDALENRALAFLMISNYSSAISDYLHLSDVGKLSPEANLKLSESYYFLKRYDSALVILNKFKQTELAANFLFIRAMSSTLNQEYVSAFLDFKYLFDRNDSEISILRGYAINCSMTNRDSLALQLNQIIFQKDTNNITSLINLGFSYWQMDSFIEANKLFEKVYRIDKQNPDVLIGLIITNYKMNIKENLKDLISELYVIFPQIKDTGDKRKILLSNGYILTDSQISTLQLALTKSI